MTTLNTSKRPINIGMIGAGTVGGGVYEIIMGRLGGSAHNHNDVVAPLPTTQVFSNLSIRRCIIRKICVRDLNKQRTFQVDENATTMVTDVNSILEDDSIDLVVEVMGGVGCSTDLARDVVLQCLKRGKSVVTANKALIGEYLEEIREIVLKSNGKVKFAYEGAVCGGVPIIQTLQGCYSGDIINEVMGICNGTTNYILEKMEDGSSDLEELLKEVQQLGISEASPQTDINGHDVQAKMAILAKLAFGTTVPISSIPCKGITEISSVDFEYAKLLKCKIKLVGTAMRLSEFGEHDGPLCVYVSPKVIPSSHLLASTEGCGNTITIDSANIGTMSFKGPGAGRFPTANSIVADICRIANGTVYPDPFPLTSSIELDFDYSSCFYVRVSFQDELGIIRNVGEVAERYGVSINSILQNPIQDRMFADFVVTTEECRLSQITGMCLEIGQTSYAHCEPLFMPMMRNE